MTERMDKWDLYKRRKPSSYDLYMQSADSKRGVIDFTDDDDKSLIADAPYEPVNLFESLPAANEFENDDATQLAEGTEIERLREEDDANASDDEFQRNYEEQIHDDHMEDMARSLIQTSIDQLNARELAENAEEEKAPERRAAIQALHYQVMDDLTNSDNLTEEETLHEQQREDILRYERDEIRRDIYTARLLQIAQENELMSDGKAMLEDVRLSRLRRMTEQD